MSVVLSAHSLTRRFGNRTAVDGVSLSLTAGRITCLLGPSGCGKSTLIRLLAGLERPDDGEVRKGDGQALSRRGQVVPAEQRNIGYVFQDYALFPHLNVADNIAFGLTHQSRAERRARVETLLRLVRLEGRDKAYPQTLSGGEQQRVALARALARNPAAVFLDEPFSGLDTGLRQEVRDASLAALRASGAAVLLVTHDAEEALSMGDDMALMSGGRLLQTGSPRDCYLNPVSETAARLLGETNLLSAVVQQQTAQTAFGPLMAPDHADGPVRVSVRPEGLIAAEPESQGSVTARVIESRYRGAVCDLTLVANGHEAHVHWPALTAPETGDTVHVRLDPRFCRIFT